MKTFTGNHEMSDFRRFFLLNWLVILLYFSSVLSQSSGAVVEAGYISGNIKFDGFVKEAVWQQAPAIDRFTQREPHEGEPATEKTVIRILHNDNYLFIGIQCYDSHPELIIAKEMERDGNLGIDDNITLVLDTYRDFRAGFYFQINPNGALFDGQLSSGGDDMNRNWDGIWDARAHITDWGWEAEVVIPFKSLRFKKEKVHRWGLNVRRYLARKNEQDLWQAWLRNQGVRQLSAAGELILKGDLKQGKHLDLKPYITTGVQRAEEDGAQLDTHFKTGLDVKYGLSSNLTLDLTLNTDFAQVESDRAKINLTRFSLFYPEKRDFFLENSSNFNFGSYHRVMAFYSRRIGLSPDREQIPILGGARLSGKVGGTNIGFLNVQTRADKGIPSTNFTVLRLKQDIFRKSYVGMIFTNKSPADTGTVNQVAGADIELSTSRFMGNRNLVFHSYYMKTIAPFPQANDHAFRAFVDYPNDLFDNFISYMEVGENFNPEMGFVWRRNIRTVYGHVRFMPRPNFLNIRKFIFQLRGYYTTDFDNVLQTRDWEFRPFAFVLHTGDEMEFNIQHNYDRLEEDFNIFEDFVIPAGIYQSLRYELQVYSARRRPVSGGLEWNEGEFYTGHRRRLEFVGRLRLNKYVSLTGDYLRTDIRLSDGKFTTHETSARLNINFTPRLTSRLFVQWNNEDNELNFNFRLRWIPRLGSDVYLVYNEIQETDVPGFRSQNRVLMAKFIYWFGM